MKTEKEIIDLIEKGLGIGMSKYYLNALLFCINREDLCPKVLTNKKYKQIIKELKEKSC